MRKVINIFLFIITLYCTLKNDDCVSQWIQQSIPVNKPISGIEFVDSLRGWACTDFVSKDDSAYVLATTDGGENWFIQLARPKALFRAMDMVDANVGYVGGYELSPGPGTIVYKTTNGGQNWFSTNITVSLGIDDIQFLNKDSGYICAGTGIDLFTTTNGGQNWTQRLNGINAHPSEIFFLDYNTGYCGAQDKIYKTTNAGLNWILKGDFLENVYTIYFINNDLGWVGFSLNTIRATTNGGDNWFVQDTPPNSNSPLYEIKFYNESTGWAGTGFLNIFKTTNGGSNWFKQTLDSSSSRAVWVLDSSYVWCGREKIYKTTNGGSTSISLTGTGSIPSDYSLKQNYPNPFNPETKIRFSIPRSSEVHLNIYNILGKEIESYKSPGLLTAGEHEFKFISNELPSGTYIYRISIYDAKGFLIFNDSKKMLLVK